jgi:hypothetical protein
MFLSLPPLKTRIGADDVYTKTGVSPPPTTSTGNDNADQFRSNVHKYAAAAALAQPELAPFLATGVLVVDGWIALGAFLSGESKDDQKYVDQAQIAVSDFLTHGFIPRKWVKDVEFAADYAAQLGKQINAMTLYPSGDTFVETMLTDFGMSIVALASDPDVKTRLSKGNASPFSAMVPDSGWKYGLDDSYPDTALMGLVAAKRFGGSIATSQAHAASLLSTIRSKGVTVPSTWPADPNDQAYDAAKATAAIWNALGGSSRGYFLSASGTAIDAKTGAALPKAPAPMPPTSATGGGPSIGQDTVKLGVTAGAVWLGYKYIWPWVKRKWL